MDYYWLIYLAVFFVGTVFIWHLNIFVSVVYSKNTDNDNHLCSISILLFNRLKLYTIKVSPSDFFKEGAPEQKPGDREQEYGVTFEKRKGLAHGEGSLKLSGGFLKKLLEKVYFEKLHFRLNYGFEDAALTGMSNGALAALRGVFLAVFGTYFKIKEEPDISFNPIYGRDFFEIEFRCILRIRLGNVISIITGSMTEWFKYNIQGGGERWRSILFRT